MKILINCEECDSEYIIAYEEGLVADEPKYCVICNSIIEYELYDDIDIEDAE